MKIVATICLAGLFCAPAPIRASDQWNAAPRGSVSLFDSAAINPSELSGVTYWGPSPTPGLHQFYAVQDSNAELAVFDVDFSANGTVLSTATITDFALISSTLDFEGIAYTNSTLDSVFVSYEMGPGVKEFSLSTGALTETIVIPPVFSSIRSNRGFESLARSADGAVMWTANEEALTIDGVESTTAAGTTVRLLRLDNVGGTFQAGAQHAYLTEPIHPGGLFPDRSGLADLVVLPDGTLLALERSFNVLASPNFLSSIYQVDFAGATDVSTAVYNSGLIGQSYTPVDKELLWSGAADGAGGQNLEGLALGPQLANGNWVLLGVSDDGSSTTSTIASWELSPVISADFNDDGTISGNDFLAFQRGYGTQSGAMHAHGDADRDGDVDHDDLAVWQSSYGTFGVLTRTATLPEPSTLLLGAMASLPVYYRRRTS